MLQVQAGTLKSAATVLDRLSELATLGSDITKTTADISNYCTEFNSLVSELNVLTSDSFNGTSLFSSGTTTGNLVVFLSQDGSQTMTISQATLANSYSAATTFANATSAGISNLTSAVQNLASIMAQNGSESSRLQFALDSLNVNQVNLEAANSRIYDVDVAAETAKLARANILVQAGAAMLTQANASQSIALKLLQ
jgi:flagellin